MVHGYDIKTSLDFFRKLLDEREDFLKNPSSARFAINCAITAWQLHDWIYAEKDKYVFMTQFDSKSKFRNYLYKKDHNFRTIHDLADGAKHYQLTNRKTTILDTKISNWKSLSKYKKKPEDEENQLFLTMDLQGVRMTMSFDDLLYVITFFWYDFFVKNLNVDLGSMFENYTAF